LIKKYNLVGKIYQPTTTTTNMSATTNTTNATRVKSLAIVFCRLSRLPDDVRGIMSLDSQEHTILQALLAHGIGVYISIKTIGSAYHGCEPQRQLINVLKNSKNKIIYVYEPNRLSRNVAVFEEIVNVCRKNKHQVFVITLNRMFEDVSELRPFIADAERESVEMGRRISRSYEFKKSREPTWGKMSNGSNEIVDSPLEQGINHLVRLLGSKGSSVDEIAKMISQVGKTEGKEPFALVEYDRNSTVDVIVRNLPYPMSVKDIADTLKCYEVRHRKRLNWTRQEIVDILNSKPTGMYQGYDTNVESLINDFEVLGTEVKCEEARETQWIYVWYDPTIGLPPNVRLPTGMKLPAHPCELCIPKL